MNSSTGLIKVKRERLVKPQGSGMFGRWVVVAAGLGAGYLIAPTAPIVGALLGGAVLLTYLRDAQTIQHPEDSEKINLLLKSKTARHPSIWESRKELKALYPTSSVNEALRFMCDRCEWVEFSRNSKHPLRHFGEVYAFICPNTEEVMMPIDGLHHLMRLWGVEGSINVEPLAVLPSIEQQAIAPAATTPTYKGVPILPGDRNTLLNRLKSECPELLRLVKAPPIRLVGKQRTGKSTFARKLALLRVVLLEGHKTLWATPHREADNLVPELLNPIGTTAEGAKDFGAIESYWVATQDAIDKGQQLNLSVCWDEFGSYDQFENTDLLGSSLRSLLRESTKHGYHPIVVAHGDQSHFYPGIKNCFQTLKESTIKVETIGEQANEFGEMRPTGRVQITWLDGTQSEFQTPEWLTVEYLISMVGGADTKPAFMAQSEAESKPIDSTPKSQLSERDRLELLFEASPNQASEETVKPDLFDKFAATLNHEAQAELKSFVLWLKKYKGQEISYDQIKGSWARHAGVARSREALMPIISVAKSNKLISPLANNNWMVAS